MRIDGISRGGKVGRAISVPALQFVLVVEYVIQIVSSMVTATMAHTFGKLCAVWIKC